MKKKIMIYLSLCLLILTGCMGGKTYPEIKLDPGNGGVKSISMDDAIAKKDNGENFLLIVTQSNCLYCMDFFAQSDDYIKEKGIMLWCIILDEEDYSEQQNLKLVHEHFGDFDAAADRRSDNIAQKHIREGQDDQTHKDIHADSAYPLAKRFRAPYQGR